MVSAYKLYVFDGPDTRASTADPTGERIHFHVLPFEAAPRGAGKPPERECVAVHDNVSLDQIHWLQGLDWLLGQPIDVLNISMGPHSSLFYPADPLQMATRAFVSRNISVVVSAGNRGPKSGTLQPLAQAPWVISAGAVDETDKLLPKSSRGWPDGAQPTIVACGTAEHLEGVRDFPPGTSFAAGRVSRSAAMTLRCLQLVMSDLIDIQKKQWSPLSQFVRRPVLGLPDSGLDVSALPKKIDLYRGGDVQISRTEREHRWYTRLLETLKVCGIAAQVSVAPAVIKRALSIMAKPLADYAPHEVGAGLVSIEQIGLFFQEFTPSRFVQLFVPDGPGSGRAAIEQLDKEIGPLWDEAKVSLFTQLFFYDCGFAVARVKE
jgi:hypothetical protein